MYEEELMYDKPIEYKKALIYPIKMKDCLNFLACINCLLIEKNKIPDIKVIKMSYLEFLFSIVNDNEINNIYIQMLWHLYTMVLKDQPFQFRLSTDNHVFFLIGNEVYNSDDFDNIREIICMQNEIDISKTYMDAELEQALREAQEQKSNIEKNRDVCGLEDQIISYHISTGYDYEKIYDLTIRKFRRGMQRMDLKLSYQIYKTSETSGMVEFKEPITHWLGEIKKTNKYADVMVEADSVLSKLKDVSVMQ